MSRGISDPAPLVDESQLSDLPSMAEVDEALQQLFAEVAELRVEVRVLREIIGASIASVRPSNGSLTGL